MSDRALRALPSGPVDLVRQLGILLAAYYAYRLTRGAVDDGQGAALAFDHARDLIDIERSLGLFFEPSLHATFRDLEPLNWAANLLYMNAQTTVVGAAVAWLYFRHNEHFYFVRNMFVVSFVLAIVGYVLFPTAPPRFFGEYGFEDTVSDFAGVDHNDGVNALFNPYAAVPSMHCAFAIMVAVPLARLSVHRWARVAWAVYPLVMAWCVVVTANHWWLDAALGAATAALSAYAAAWLARARPAAWAFNPVRV
jgi:membrane-associated phospholipid phosphatase